ncbi:MAG TPA: hypothetical protein VHC19_17415 [Pirellulales bacterium]|nr:hypothetical protein [Pirellulales bacterium]
MSLRIHRGEFGVDRLSLLESEVEALPWDSLEAAQAAFDAAPFERLAADEIETMLGWQSSSGKAALRAVAAPRSTACRLCPETLERRDTPTPALAFNLLAIALPPAIADWNDRRALHGAADGSAYVAAEQHDGRIRRIATMARACTVSPAADSLLLAIVPLEAVSAAGAALDYQLQPNDWALVELLSASAPNSRSLEPLSLCA